MLSTNIFLVILAACLSGLGLIVLINSYCCAIDEIKSPAKYRYHFKPMYWGVIIANIIIFIIAMFCAPNFIVWCALCLCGSILLALAWIDSMKMILPDSLNYILLWSGLLINSTGLLTSPYMALWGAALGYSVLWLIFYLFKALSKKEGMGYGDFKLCAALGAWLGVQSLPQLLLLSSLSGIIMGLIINFWQRRSWRHAIAFGPHMALAGWLLLVYQSININNY